MAKKRHEISSDLLRRMRRFVDEAIINHDADAVSIPDSMYKEAWKLRKEITQKLEKRFKNKKS